MTSIPDDAYIDWVAAALALPIAAEDRPAVVENLRLLIAQSQIFMALDLDAETESALTFTP